MFLIKLNKTLFYFRLVALMQFHQESQSITQIYHPIAKAQKPK